MENQNILEEPLIKTNKQAYYKQYYEKNKKDLIEKALIKNKCDICECAVAHSNMSRHIKTSKKHQQCALIAELKLNKMKDSTMLVQ